MRKLFFTMAAIAAAIALAKETPVFPILRSAVSLGRQDAGFYLLPTNQILRPWGDQVQIPGRPVELAFDSKKRTLAVLNSRSVLLLDGLSGAEIADVKTFATSYTGLAFRPDDRELWVSETSRNGPDSIAIIHLDENGRPAGLDRIPYAEGHPLPAGIAFSSDGKKAYVAMSRNNSLAVIDVASHATLREVPVGMAPFDVVVSNVRNRVFVSNRAGRRPVQGDTTAPSSGSMVVTNPVTGATTSGTVTVVDAETFQTQTVDVGLAPSDLTLSSDKKLLAVTNGHSDSASILDTSTLARTDVKIPTWPNADLGSQPIASRFSPDGNRLYVTCGGNNAVAILERAGAAWKVAGAVPVGYFPSAVEIDGQGALKVLNVKGFANTATGKGTFNSRQYIGTLSQIPPVTRAQLAAGTREVIAANTPKFDSAGGVDRPSLLGIQHVILIVKENRTYDQVFGDIARGNGDPKLVHYGRNVTPNHHALAEKYVLLDNFHTGGAISFDGHQWLMQEFVSDYTERAFAASPRGYAWNMADALTVAPTGFFWQGTGKPIDLRIYGEFALPARWNPATGEIRDINEREVLSWSDYIRLYREGKWQSTVGSRCGVPALQAYQSRAYPHGSTSIPDQLRADVFLNELADYEKKGTFPQLVVLDLNSDHTNGTRPGSPTPRAMVADNDLALGRIVEAVSKSQFWPKTLILVVEDDAQDGLDHVDGHRTVALAVGPYVRRGVTDSNLYNHTSMIRTIQDLLHIAPRTRFGESARAMTSVFTKDADTSSYTALKSNIDPLEMNPPLKSLNGRQRWAALQSMAMNWSEPDDIPQQTLNRILWWDAKGWTTPYPGKQ